MWMLLKSNEVPPQSQTMRVSADRQVTPPDVMPKGPNRQCLVVNYSSGTLFSLVKQGPASLPLYSRPCKTSPWHTDLAPSFFNLFFTQLSSLGFLRSPSLKGPPLTLSRFKSQRTNSSLPPKTNFFIWPRMVIWPSSSDLFHLKLTLQNKKERTRAQNRQNLLWDMLHNAQGLLTRFHEQRSPWPV